MENLVGQRLREAREDKNYTQVQVKKLTGINNKTLSGYENGVSEPDIDTLKILSKLYSVSVDYLIGLTNDPTPSVEPKEPSPKEYVLLSKTLNDATTKLGELIKLNRINEQEFLELTLKAYEKFGLVPAKKADPAAHLEHKIPATGVFDKVAEEKNEYKP